MADLAHIRTVFRRLNPKVRLWNPPELLNHAEDGHVPEYYTVSRRADLHSLPGLRRAVSRYFLRAAQHDYFDQQLLPFDTFEELRSDEVPRAAFISHDEAALEHTPVQPHRRLYEWFRRRLRFVLRES